MDKPIRVLSVFGTRPEAIKMAPVVRRLAETPGIRSMVCATAQHRQMLDQVLHLFEIVPDVDLDLMRPDQSLAEITAAVFERLDPVIKELRPDWILAEGDTTSVMAVGLLSYYNRVRFGHVEAGLRTGDRWNPFPEEINRVVAGAVADLHFAPTEWARGNLRRENVPDEKIIVTGNPVIDALHYAVGRSDTEETVRLLDRVGLEQVMPLPADSPRLVLVTAHRRENFGAPLERICAALKELAHTCRGTVRIVYPVHLNPKVWEPVHHMLGSVPGIVLLPPLEYLPLAGLLRRAAIVLTDSGGLQEEAPALGIPVLVMREATERPEGVAAGTARLVGTDTARIVMESRRLLDDPEAHAAMARVVNPYGDGHAAARIVSALLHNATSGDASD
jgi:UDP-N-acetylglucosamine 2-epimerase (non-hydrolysing)